MLDWSLKHPLIDNVLDPLSIIIGIILAIPVFWTWWDLVIGRHRRHKQWMHHAVTTKGDVPVVLIVDLLPGKDITVAIQHFMAGNAQLKDIPGGRVVKISRNTQLTPEHMPALATEIQNAVADVLRHGADELHVFIAAPGCVSAMTGAELSNISCRVLLYQTGAGSNTYVNFGPLRHPRF